MPEFLNVIYFLLTDTQVWYEGELKQSLQLNSFCTNHGIMLSIHNEVHMNWLINLI